MTEQNAVAVEKKQRSVATRNAARVAPIVATFGIAVWIAVDLWSEVNPTWAVFVGAFGWA